MTKSAFQSKTARFVATLLCAMTVACSVTPPKTAHTVVTSHAFADVVAQVETATVAPPAAEIVTETTPLQTAEAEADVDADAETAPEGSLRRLRSGELNQKLIDKSVNVLHGTYHEPMGHEVAFEIDGNDYVAKVEWHYREPGSKKLPWGKHRGISLYIYDVAS